MSEEHFIKENLEEVRRKIAAACEKSGRQAKEVTLIAVSKTKPVSMLQEAYDQSVREFGENKVQELCDKYPVLPPDIHWHLIGHLQRNKVKYVVGKAALIHSVDSLRLAEEIQKEAEKKQVDVSILLQVNVAKEDTKSGFYVEELMEAVERTAALNRIQIKGLMTIAPYVENPEENRSVFSKLKQLSVDIALKNIDNVNMNVLSMGMTGDYQVAIEEGATHVRVGTGIFGARNYNITAL
jgi:pyridoxal phosphate enzyme (YggS family)